MMLYENKGKCAEKTGDSEGDPIGPPGPLRLSPQHGRYRGTFVPMVSQGAIPEYALPVQLPP